MLYDVSIEDWNAYLRVQRSGKYNMLDPMARMSAGLDKSTWMAIIKNYAELAEQYPS